MKLVLLGLKEKKTGNYFIYDVTGNQQHVQIAQNETKNISTLAPFPFANFSSLDTFNEQQFERCYVEVEGELSEREFQSMKSAGIRYHRFAKRQVTLRNEFVDIFQYALEMYRRFGKQLGTYDLTTWVMHNETKNEAEFHAMKQIITKAVQKKDNQDYPLDISLDCFTAVYLDVFRDLSKQGYAITFGRYGTNDRRLFLDHTIPLSDETFLYVLQHVRLYDYSFFEHPSFTPIFYEVYIKDTAFEEELFFEIKTEDLETLQKKLFDLDSLYLQVFKRTVARLNQYDLSYGGDMFKIFTDPTFEPHTIYSSPLDYYCCEDCDGYDIYEMYDEEELEGEEVVVDERLDYMQQIIGNWGNFLTETSYSLFDRIPDEFFASCPNNAFFTQLLAFRQHQKN